MASSCVGWIEGGSLFLTANCWTGRGAGRDRRKGGLQHCCLHGFPVASGLGLLRMVSSRALLEPISKTRVQMPTQP